jgi:hypothetical protein
MSNGGASSQLRTALYSNRHITFELNGSGHKIPSAKHNFPASNRMARINGPLNCRCIDGGAVSDGPKIGYQKGLAFGTKTVCDKQESKNMFHAGNIHIECEWNVKSSMRISPDETDR